jgi:hypothetical protein
MRRVGEESRENGIMSAGMSGATGRATGAGMAGIDAAWRVVLHVLATE